MLSTLSEYVFGRNVSTDGDDERAPKVDDDCAGDDGFEKVPAAAAKKFADGENARIGEHGEEWVLINVKDVQPLCEAVEKIDAETKNLSVSHPIVSDGWYIASPTPLSECSSHCGSLENLFTAPASCVYRRLRSLSRDTAGDEEGVLTPVHEAQAERALESYARAAEQQQERRRHRRQVAAVIGATGAGSSGGCCAAVRQQQQQQASCGGGEKHPQAVAASTTRNGLRRTNLVERPPPRCKPRKSKRPLSCQNNDRKCQ